MRLFASILVTVTTFVTFAGSAQAKQKGMNERVALQYLSSNWGSKMTLTGFYTGTATINVVPVTHEAMQVLEMLDKKTPHECLIHESTFVPTLRESETVGGTYFVISLGCE